jgi:hypothetical protein
MQVTFPNQPAGATNLLMVSFCPGNCSSGSTTGAAVNVSDTAGDAYVTDYRVDGPGATLVLRAPTNATASNIITVSIPSSDTSVVMASQFSGAWIPDSANTSGDLLYAVFVGGCNSACTAGSGMTQINNGQWWTDAYGTLPVTPTFMLNGSSVPATFSLAYKSTTAHQAVLTWQDTVNPAGTTWKVYRSPGAAWNPVLLSTVTVKNYTDTTVVSGQNYVYKITALNNGVESDGPSAVTVSVQ